MTQQMQSMALDFAAFHNISDEEAMSRVISAMSGSSEVLDQFGVNIKAAAIDQQMLEMGINETTATATEQQKVMARLAIIAESLGAQGAIGAAARESESYANKMKLLNAKLKDLAIVVGEQVLPRVIELMDKGIDMAEAVKKWTEEHPELAKQLERFAELLVLGGGGALALGGAIGVVTPLLNPATALVAGMAIAVKRLADMLEVATDNSKSLEERIMAVAKWASPLIAVMDSLGITPADALKNLGQAGLPKSAAGDSGPIWTNAASAMTAAGGAVAGVSVPAASSSAAAGGSWAMAGNQLAASARGYMALWGVGLQMQQTVAASNAEKAAAQIEDRRHRGQRRTRKGAD
jgi:hypothetical protein